MTIPELLFIQKTDDGRDMIQIVILLILTYKTKNLAQIDF